MLINFLDWEKGIDKSSATVLNIPNHLEFENDQLIISHYPNLVDLTVIFAALQEIVIENCPNLITVNVSNNKLKVLGVKHLTKLRSLWCFNNNLRELDCSDLAELEDLNCASNVELVDYESIEDLYGINYLYLDNCLNLKYLDAAENSLVELDFSHLLNLECLSLRENKVQENTFVEDKILTLNSPNLRLLDTSLSNIEDVTYLCDTPYLNQAPTQEEIIKAQQYYQSLEDKRIYSPIVIMWLTITILITIITLPPAILINYQAIKKWITKKYKH